MILKYARLALLLLYPLLESFKYTRLYYGVITQVEEVRAHPGIPARSAPVDEPHPPGRPVERISYRPRAFARGRAEGVMGDLQGGEDS